MSDRARLILYALVMCAIMSPFVVLSVNDWRRCEAEGGTYARPYLAFTYECLKVQK